MLVLCAAVFAASCLLQATAAATNSTLPAPITASTTQASSGGVAAAPATQLADSPTPSDPRALLELGRKVNGLGGANVAPWHLKANYEVFSLNGTSKYKGTYEELWVSEKRYKRSYQSPEFSQTEFGTDHGIFRQKDAHGAMGAAALVSRFLVEGNFDEVDLNNWNLMAEDRTLGDVKVRCVSIVARTPVHDQGVTIRPAHCFEVNKPLLRMVTGSGNVEVTVYNRVVLFRGRYLGGDISFSVLGKPVLQIHLDSAETLTPATAAALQPPADAVPSSRRIAADFEAVRGRSVFNPHPAYPHMALLQHAQGTVVLLAVVDRDGHVSELDTLGGPPALIDAARTAVQHWVYKPYVLEGERVEFVMPVEISFTANF